MSEIKEENSEKKSLNFIESIVEEDLRTGRDGGRVHTRFPPEPNGYLHIGHGKAICLDFGIAEKYGGKCNLRFDDTNPIKEDVEYVDSIKEDVRWMGFDWEDREYYASDYFEQLFEYAVKLIKAGKAYVDSLSAEEIREYRGTLTQPGKNSPFRDRSIEENLDLFKRMQDGEFKDGEHVLRAKIDMASGNLNLRDPVIYRVRRAVHHRTGDKWCIYPMYDFTHGQSDSIEKITHSVCTLEFENHRPLYDWFCEKLGIFHPRQIEFARLNLSYTVMSKRKLLQLIADGCSTPEVAERLYISQKTVKNHLASIYQKLEARDPERGATTAADPASSAELAELEGRIEELGWMSVRGWSSSGGSELGINRKVPSGHDYYTIARTIEDRSIDAMLIIGGWSAYHTAYRFLSKREAFPAFDIPIIFLPP